MVSNTTPSEQDATDEEQPRLDAVYSKVNTGETLRLTDDDGNAIIILRGKMGRLSVTSSDYDIDVYDKGADDE